MRWGYSPFTHRTVVSQPLGQLSDVHGSDARQPPKIPRRDVRRTMVERANRRRVMVCSRRRGSGPPLGRSSRRLPSGARVVPSLRNPTTGAAGPSGIESRIPGTKGSGALIRPRLGASQLSGIGARLAGTESVPEPAEPLPLLGIGPDHQMLPTADASSMDIAPLDPFLESVVSHAEFVRQVANPPFVDRQPLGGPSPRAQTQSGNPNAP